MNSIFALIELLVIGIQASIWVTLLYITLFGLNPWVIIINRFHPWAGHILIVLLAFWLTMGIVVDRLATFWIALYNPKRIIKKIKRLHRKITEEAEDGRMTLLSVINPEKALQFIEGIRSRARILRAGLFNLSLTMLVSLLLLFSSHNLFRFYSQRMTGLLIMVSWLILYSVGFFILGTFEAGYEARVEQILKMTKKDKGEC